MLFDAEQEKYEDMSIEDKLGIVCESPLQPIREREKLARRLARRRALTDDIIRKRIYDLFLKLRPERFEQKTQELFSSFSFIF